MNIETIEPKDIPMDLNTPFDVRILSVYDNAISMLLRYKGNEKKFAIKIPDTREWRNSILISGMRLVLVLKKEGNDIKVVIA